MDQIQASLDEAVGRRWIKLQLSEEALAVSNQNSRIMLEAILVNDKRASEGLLKERNENSARITALLTQIEGQCESEEEKSLLLHITQTRARYVDGYMRAFHLSQEDQSAAESLTVTNTLPAIQEYHRAWYSFVKYEQRQADQAKQQATTRYVSARRTAWLLLLLATAIAVVIAVFVTRQTMREITRRIRVQKEVFALNTELEQRVATRTQELTEANSSLMKEVEERRRAEDQVREEVAARTIIQCELQKSEERLNLAMQAADIGFWDWDLTSGEQTWSDRAKTLLGLPAESPADFETLMGAVHPDFREKMWAAINQAIENHKDLDFEFASVWPDKSVHWQMSKGRAFYDESGRATRMMGIVINADWRKAAEDKLRLQAMALEAAGSAIVITNSRPAILWANPAFTKMTGYNLSEVVGANPRFLASGKQDQAFYRNLWDTISSGNVWRGEIINRRKNGNFYTEGMTIAPVISDRGEITHYIAIKQEITDRKPTQDSALQAEQKSEDTKTTAACVTDISHR
jgi:PAS domain S-box-containing protein